MALTCPVTCSMEQHCSMALLSLAGIYQEGETTTQTRCSWVYIPNKLKSRECTTYVTSRDERKLNMYLIHSRSSVPQSRWRPRPNSTTLPAVLLSKQPSKRTDLTLNELITAQQWVEERGILQIYARQSSMGILQDKQYNATTTLNTEKKKKHIWLS